jgi:putative tryptophan/tyrosine transport system substrate-binding protein
MNVMAPSVAIWPPARPPGEQPVKFDLVINLKNAKALDLTIPLSILLRVDRLIE